MQTSQRQISMFTETKSTSLREDFPVSPTARQGNAKAKTTNATYGPICYERYVRFGRVGLWAKTFSELLLGMTGWYSKRCALSWSLRATKYNRLFFQLRPSTLPTEETEYGLLPTIQTQGLKVCDEDGSTQFIDLSLLPTPRVFAYKDSATDCGKSNLGEVTGAGSQLSPRFVAEMMGFPVNWTELPFQSGATNQSRDMETP